MAVVEIEAEPAAEEASIPILATDRDPAAAEGGFEPDAKARAWFSFAFASAEARGPAWVLLTGHAADILPAQLPAHAERYAAIPFSVPGSAGVEQPK